MLFVSTFNIYIAHYSWTTYKEHAYNDYLASVTPQERRDPGSPIRLLHISSDSRYMCAFTQWMIINKGKQPRRVYVHRSSEECCMRLCVLKAPAAVYLLPSDLLVTNTIYAPLKKIFEVPCVYLHFKFCFRRIAV